MGKLRIEPREKPFDKKRFDELSKILIEANESSEESDIYWDLDDHEVPIEVKREFLQVASELKIELTIRRKRHTRTLQFMFGNSSRRERLSAEEARERIIEAIKQLDSPVKKSDVLKQTGLTQATWNLRIKELLSSGTVKRFGTRRDASYALA